MDETIENDTVAVESELEEDNFEIVISDKTSGDARIRRLELYRAALSGDWSTAASIHKEHPDDILARITKQGDTALHVAAAENKTAFVKKLVNYMKDEDLALMNDLGNTAIHYAASHGHVEIAEVMIKKNKELAMIRNKDGMLPFHMAALSGHEVMVRFLYRRANHDQLDEKEKMDLLVASINADLYDFAWELLKEYPDLAFSRDSNGETALHALALKSETSSAFTDPRQETIFGWSHKFYEWFSGEKDDLKLEEKIFSERNRPMLTLAREIWTRVITLDDQKITQLIGRPWRLIFVAAKKGDGIFLRTLINEYPDIVHEFDENGYSIFHIAVLYRQESVLRLIHDIGPLKDSILSFRDGEGNNILHLAAKLPPMYRLNVVEGAAFEMQHERLWFKKVSKIVRPSYTEAENNDRKKPRELFDESHKELKKEGETWMKDAANSCTVVATLVTTVVFAAAFTIPGGNKEDTGAPHFLRDASFKIFFVADAISLVFSTISVLTFLSVLTSTYSEEDIPWPLHIRLLDGFASLCCSITAMMVAFCAACFIILNGETPWIPILVTCLACMPVRLCFSQYHRFLLIFFSPIKNFMLRTYWSFNKSHG